MIEYLLENEGITYFWFQTRTEFYLRLDSHYSPYIKLFLHRNNMEIVKRTFMIKIGDVDEFLANLALIRPE